MFLHVLKASASNGSKNKKWYFFGRKLWSGLEHITPSESLRRTSVLVLSTYLRREIDALVSVEVELVGEPLHEGHTAARVAVHVQWGRPQTKA